MPTTQQRAPEQEMEPYQREALNALIGERALHTLGEPKDLLRVQVRWLWENCYRLNVFVGPDAASAKVAHSFFLVADREGNITGATPKITRQY